MYVNLTLLDLQKLALSFIGETPGQSHYATVANIQCNQGLIRMYDKTQGVQDIATLNVVAGTRGYALPAGFIKDKEVLLNGMPIRYTDFDGLNFYSTGQGRPQNYAFWGKPTVQILLGPLVPDAAYSLSVYHYRSPVSLVNPIDVPELPYQFMAAPAYWAAYNLCVMVGHLELAAGPMQMFKEVQAEFLTWYNDESGAHPSRVKDSVGW